MPIPVRIVDGPVARDETGRAIDAVPVISLDADEYTNEAGQAVDPIDVTETTDTTYRDSAGHLRAVMAVYLSTTALARNAAGIAVGAIPVFGLPKPPENQTTPEITGTEQVGETLTATTGTWTNTPETYTYQWQRNTGTWGDISGATDNSYLLTATDEGATIRVQVIASNSAGPSDPAFSTATGAIQPA